MRIIKLIPFSLLFVFLFVSCGGPNSNGNKTRQAKGNVYYGGVFKINEIESFRNLFPHSVTEVTSQRITSQVYEGLIKLSQKDLTILPSLAEKWDKNEDATVWTFYLRKGIKFHDDSCFAEGKGREMDASDFKYAFTKLCEKSEDNLLFGYSFKNKVLGANEYYESTLQKKPLPEGVSGIKVIDRYTLQISLTGSFSTFLNILTTPACWVFPKEAYDKYGVDMRIHCVGTGPFRVKNVKEGESVILERNPNYWDIDEFGNQLPYLDGIKTTFVKEKKSEFLEFKKGNLDMIFRLPTELIPEILGELEHAKEENSGFTMQVSPAMSTFYLGFQNFLPPFNKKQVREAFNYAIDRQKMVIFTLQGEGIPATYGFVPPAFKDYEYKSVHGFEFNPEKAKKLLAEGGYPNGKGFPKITLQINNGGGDRNVQVAEIVQKMLKENLNVEIDINVMPQAEHLDNVEMGRAMFWRAMWVADYPDPEIFLTLMYGALVPDSLNERSNPNTFRYKNPRFDSIFNQALRETDTKRRYELYRQADQIIIDDAVLMPVFYDENYRLIKKNVRNFDANAMEIRDFTRVYFAPEESENK